MRMTAVLPSDRLAPFVRLFRFVETDEEATRVLVPDGAVVAGFRYSGGACLLEDGSAHRVPGATLAGVRDTVRRMRTSAGGGVLLAVFHEGGASAFTDAPLHELFGATLGLDALAPAAEVEAAADRIASARDHEERVRHFEEFLIARQRRERPDALVAAAVRAIRTDPAGVRIGPLAAALGLSRDRLEKRFRRAVGASPKQLASILRMRRAVEAYRPGVSLTHVSAHAGYYDQSHFNRAFRSVTGQAPRRFFGTTEHC
jgi:AraC-like DNA-binding protein